MSINLADKYSTKVAERFSCKSLTDAWAGKDYEFSGVRTLKVYSINTVALADYKNSAALNRFGTPSEISDTVQEMTISKDRAFTFSIDHGNNESQFNVKQATQCLKREIDEVVTPEVDTYRLNAWATGAGVSQVNASLTSSNIVEAIFTLNASLSDAKVPYDGRVLFIPELTFVKFKLASVVMGYDGAGAKVVRNGYKGTIDGLDVVAVPASYMPTGVNFIIKQRNATVDPIKLKNYRVQTNPMGVDGDVIEGRIMYDSFVLTAKCSGIGKSVTA